MARTSTELERARDAAALEEWNDVHELLNRLDPSILAPKDFEALADAAWWLCRRDESLDARRKAYDGYLKAGNIPKAAFQTWHLFYEHLIGGEMAIATGWLKRAQRHLVDQPESEVNGYLAFADCDLAHASGELDDALTHGRRVAEIGQRHSDPNLVALGMVQQGRTLISGGKVGEGTALLDEAMVGVLSNDVTAFFQGLVYCYVLSACQDVADLKRAGEWSEVAVRWCRDLPPSHLYHGLCRVHHVEIMSLHGALTDAELQAQQVCEDLLPWDPASASHAFYLYGEIQRRKGDSSAAERAFKKAHELGRDPQPGLALLRLTQGKADAAASALRNALAGESWNRLGRARLLGAQCEAAAAAGDLATARAAADELDQIASDFGPPALRASAGMARATQRLAEGDPTEASAAARSALVIWQELGLPYEAARARVLIAQAARLQGDEDAATMELEAARTAFDRLGTVPDLTVVESLLGNRPSAAAGLTHRELEVLQLVARGRSNKAIATELVISEHTVARHLSNIFMKIGVTSRSAATAFAFENDLV